MGVGRFIDMSETAGRLLLSERPMRIQRFRSGEVVIGGEPYTDDVVVFEDGVRQRWWRKEGHLLQMDDLREALADEPEALIVGTGTDGCMKISPEVVAHTRQAGIELLQFDTRRACQTFNHLHGKRKIVAVLHLTC